MNTEYYPSAIPKINQYVSGGQAIDRLNDTEFVIYLKNKKYPQDFIPSEHKAVYLRYKNKTQLYVTFRRHI